MRLKSEKGGRHTEGCSGKELGGRRVKKAEEREVVGE